MYTYADLGAHKARILATCERVRRDNPRAWANAHNGSFDRESRRFNDLCVQAVRAEGLTVGLNGKRGDPRAKSDDILCFPLVAGQGGAQDKSGRFPEIALIDFIQGAGGPGASIGWLDVSGAAPGYFLDPEGSLPDEGAAPTPVPPPTLGPALPAPTPAPVCACRAEPCPVAPDIAGIFEAFLKVSAELQEVRKDHAALVTWLGAHLTDIKTRIDATPVTTCRSRGWL
jgi:hypothetical protein